MKIWLDDCPRLPELKQVRYYTGTPPLAHAVRESLRYRARARVSQDDQTPDRVQNGRRVYRTLSSFVLVKQEEQSDE